MLPPLRLIPALVPRIYRKNFGHRLPNPLRGLRDLRAMLSPLRMFPARGPKRDR
jgi:hypothetical protein